MKNLVILFYKIKGIRNMICKYFFLMLCNLESKFIIFYYYLKLSYVGLSLDYTNGSR